MMKSTHQSTYSDHDDVLLLLPWLANGTLADGELEKVRNHLKVCLVCRRELSALEVVSATFHNTPSVDISYKPSFERLMVRIRQQESGASRGRSHASRDWLHRFGQWLRGSSGSRFLAPALAMAILAAFIPFVLQDTWRTEAPNVYQTLAMPGSMEKLAGNDVQVVFADGMSKQDISLLFKEIQGHILDGPSTRGVYTVRILPEQGLETALARLRQDKRVIFAEPALGPEQPSVKQGG
ncbi:MAG: zf-HC2 protein [Proteobacteria bacterium]|nr:zf-HC2 protein [Pseudomonadota bacterium]